MLQIKSGDPSRSRMRHQGDPPLRLLRRLEAAEVPLRLEGRVVLRVVATTHLRWGDLKEGRVEEVRVSDGRSAISRYSLVFFFF